jgi:hypothetical protein
LEKKSVSTGFTKNHKKMKNPSVFDKKNKFSKFEKENWFIGAVSQKSVNFPNKLFGFSKTRFRLNQIKTDDEVVKVVRSLIRPRLAPPACSATVATTSLWGALVA